MRTYFTYICFILGICPLLFSAQNKKTKTAQDRLEIVGKWSSYSSQDTSKLEVVEFKPDGSFIEYKNGVPKHGNIKYVLYNDELSISTNEKMEGKDITLRFRVKKESYGLLLNILDVSKSKSDKLTWVKLFPWEPK